MLKYIEEMKSKLVPHNPDYITNPDYDIIKMGMHSNLGYVSGSTVRAAIKCFEKRSIVVIAGLDELNALEKLAIMLLQDSAHM